MYELLEFIEYRTYIQIIFVEIDTVVQDKHSVKQAWLDAIVEEVWRLW